MSRSGKLSVALPRQTLLQLKDLVEAGEFASPSEVVRQAVEAWLHRRKLRAQSGERFGHVLRDASEPSERVELLFDAGDAKA